MTGQPLVYDDDSEKPILLLEIREFTVTQIKHTGTEHTETLQAEFIAEIKKVNPITAEPYETNDHPIIDPE